MEESVEQLRILQVEMKSQDYHVTRLGIERKISAPPVPRLFLLSAPPTLNTFSNFFQGL